MALHNYKPGYWGWMKTYLLAGISAGATAELDISEDDKERIGFFNALDVNNDSTENIEVWINGDSDRALIIANGVSKQLNGTRITSLTIKNTDSTNATSNNEIKITIQKEFGRREEMELKGLLK